MLLCYDPFNLTFSREMKLQYCLLIHILGTASTVVNFKEYIWQMNFSLHYSYNVTGQLKRKFISLKGIMVKFKSPVNIVLSGNGLTIKVRLNLPLKCTILLAVKYIAKRLINYSDQFLRYLFR